MPLSMLPPRGCPGPAGAPGQSPVQGVETTRGSLPFAVAPSAFSPVLYVLREDTGRGQETAAPLPLHPESGVRPLPMLGCQGLLPGGAGCEEEAAPGRAASVATRCLSLPPVHLTESSLAELGSSTAPAAPLPEGKDQGGHETRVWGHCTVLGTELMLVLRDDQWEAEAAGVDLSCLGPRCLSTSGPLQMIPEASRQRLRVGLRFLDPHV
ncbi:hypothetical protein H920_05473 [Fukomys damarensis]|uniref:Uncharacterized protein n=1 Tax=Fukomys damarensis TaxID=885580 RepID=A0A091DSQ2_FUKDA|nr:hypothetical protein H920_05473 [Fukomys damarensis]